MTKFKNIDELKRMVSLGYYRTIEDSFTLKGIQYDLARQEDGEYTFIGNSNMNDMIYIKIKWSNNKVVNSCTIQKIDL